MVYRQKISTAEVLSERIEQASSLFVFMDELKRLSSESSAPLDVVFQCLCQALAEMGRAVSVGAGGNFDSNVGGTFDKFGEAGFVPMHQAKVLDRSDALGAYDATIRDLAGERLPWLVDQADTLRKSLRVKVEDGNDLLMAIDTVKDVHKFMSRLQQHAGATGEEQFDLYRRLVEF